MTFEGNVPDKFDHLIELTKPRALLQDGELQEISAELDHLLAAMNDALLKAQDAAAQK